MIKPCTKLHTDLVAAYRRAIDAHIIDAIGDALTGTGPGGTNPFEDILFAMEVVREGGYNPDLVVMSPADGLGCSCYN